MFGLRVQLSLGERLVVGVATGTAVYLTALPPPLPPQVRATGTAVYLMLLLSPLPPQVKAAVHYSDTCIKFGNKLYVFVRDQLATFDINISDEYPSDKP